MRDYATAFHVTNDTRVCCSECFSEPGAGIDMGWQAFMLNSTPTRKCRNVCRPAMLNWMNSGSMMIQCNI